jgi:hypothetical protein
MSKPVGTVTDRLAALLDAQRTRRWGGARHLPTCRVGYWVDGYSQPNGAPCSARCAEIAATLAEYARQPLLLEVG